MLPEGHQPQLGLIVLETDITIEDEFRHYFEGQRLSLLTSRIHCSARVTPENLREMEGHLGESAALFPAEMNFQAIGYACTSGARHIGSERVAQLIKEHCGCRQVTDPMQASIQVFRRLGAGKIAYLSPYGREVSQNMIDALERNHIRVCAAATFNEDQDPKVGRIAPASIHRAALELCKGRDLDALFIACTNLKCAHIIPQIEADTGLQVLSSNLVLAWDMARLAGCQLNSDGWGSLVGD